MTWKQIDDYVQGFCRRRMQWKSCDHWKANLVLVVCSALSMALALRQIAWVAVFAFPGDSIASTLAYTAVTMTWQHFAMACGIAAWGGGARFLHDLRESESAFSIVNAVGHVVISQFAGVLTYLFALYLTLPWPLGLMACGLAGWGGSKAIVRLDRAVNKRMHGTVK